MAALYHAVSPVAEETLSRALQQLVEAELFSLRGVGQRATYLFKHVLIQEAAYQSLLKRTRKQHHQRIAQVLEAQFPDIAQRQPELVAHHYTEAGLIKPALPYWQRAGQKAAQRSAHVEALNHLTRGLELLKTQPDTPDRMQQELYLQTALGQTLMAVKGYAATEVQETYARARELCELLGGGPQFFPILSELVAYHYYTEAGLIQPALPS